MVFISNPTVRDMADDITGRLDSGAGNALARIYSGSVPADADAPLAGAVLLAEVPLNKPSFNAATDANPGALIAVNTAGGLTDPAANAGGVASFARLEDSTGVAHVQLTAGEADAELVLNNSLIALGQPVTIVSGSLSVPESKMTIINGNVTLSEDGAILENKIVQNGLVRIEAYNCTIRNCVIDGQNQILYNVLAKQFDGGGEPFTGLVVDNCRLYRSTSGSVNAHYATFRNCLMEDHFSDGVKVSTLGNILVDNVTILNMGTGGPTHADPIAYAGPNVQVINSHIDTPRIIPGNNVNGVCFGKTTVAAIDNLLIRDNYLNGGIHIVWMAVGALGPCTNVVCHDNTFGFDGNALQFETGTTYNQFNNKYEDGTPIPPSSNP